ncbi:MAG TPA: energy transducer TonB, partial [Chitinophagaceae bacterium]|nr:energy transducer TonB [Chitinophagaceae bacterium]
VEVEFTVYKSGSVSEPLITASADTSLSREVVRAIRSIPSWYPAVSHNRMIDHTFQLIIMFYPGQGIIVRENPNPLLRLAN